MKKKFTCGVWSVCIFFAIMVFLILLAGRTNLVLMLMVVMALVVLVSYKTAATKLMKMLRQDDLASQVIHLYK